MECVCSLILGSCLQEPIKTPLYCQWRLVDEAHGRGRMGRLSQPGMGDKEEWEALGGEQWAKEISTQAFRV